MYLIPGQRLMTASRSAFVTAPFIPVRSSSSAVSEKGTPPQVTVKWNSAPSGSASRT